MNGETMTKDSLTSPFDDEYLRTQLSKIMDTVNKLNPPIIDEVPRSTKYQINQAVDNLSASPLLQDIAKNIQNLNTPRSGARTSVGILTEVFNGVPVPNSDILNSMKRIVAKQMFQDLEQTFKNLNLSTNITNFSHLFRDVPLVRPDTLFKQSPLGAWEESEDDSVSKPPSNMEEKTSTETDSNKISKVSNNLLEQATDYGKKFSHGFFAPIKNPEELGKLVFEIMFSSLCTVFFSLAMTYGVPAAQHVVASLYLEIQRRISQTK